MFYSFTHSGILISLLRQNFKIRKCSRVANSLHMTHVFVICPFHLSNPMRRAKFLPRKILFESGWNWNFKFTFLAQYDRNTILQTKWTKNMNELKIYLVWFCSTVWKGKFGLKFFAQNIWKENITKYLLFSQIYGSISFTWVLLYLRAIGWQNTDTNWFCSN